MRIKSFTFWLVTLPANLIITSLLVGCGEEENKPTPTITSISPKAGVPGMEVTISGTNFSPTSSVVEFNGIVATTESATETELVVRVPDQATTGAVTVTTDGGASPGTDFRVYQVYVAGRERSGSGNAIVKIWKNGEPDPISDGSEHATATGFVIVGNDTYISGYHELFNGNTIPFYWKNKTVVNLSNEFGGVTTDIEVVGADVYVSGYNRGPQVGNTLAVIWKNGEVMTLDKPTDTGSRVYAIAVVGSDVHAVGDIEDANRNPTATYWKNGVATKVGAINEFRFSDVQVVGSDVYIAGWQGVGSDTRARYWKNGIINNIGTGPESSTASAISIQGGDVYVGGDEMEDGISVPKFWKNGVSQSITDGTNVTYFWKMAVVDGDVISAGIISSTSTSFYAVNNNVFPLATSLSPPRIGGVIVK